MNPVNIFINNISKEVITKEDKEIQKIELNRGLEAVKNHLNRDGKFVFEVKDNSIVVFLPVSIKKVQYALFTLELINKSDWKVCKIGYVDFVFAHLHKIDFCWYKLEHGFFKLRDTFDIPSALKKIDYVMTKDEDFINYVKDKIRCAQTSKT